jgi:hypothetical protein
MKQQSAEKDKKPAAISTSAIMYTLGLGVLSATLYYLLYLYGDDLRHLAEITNAGDKQYFYVPIIIALIFSFVHGAFTGHFWDVLGLKAKK